MLRKAFKLLILAVLLVTNLNGPLFIARAQDQAPTPDPNAVPTADPNLAIPPTPDVALVTAEPLPTPELPQPTPTEIFVPAPADTPTVDPNAIPGEVPTVEPPPIQPTLPPLPTYTPVPVPESNDPLVRVVSVGESLTTLASQAGLSVDDLAQANRVTNPNLLLTGQKIQLSSPMPESIRIHKVRAKDTLTSISAEYRVSLAALRSSNDLICSACLVAGQLLRIPQTNVQSNLSAPFESVRVFPFLPRQGDTIIVRVKTNESVTNLSGEMAGRPLNFARVDEDYVGLSGVAALQEPAIYSVTITATTKAGDVSDVSVVNGRIQVGAGNYPFENLTLAPQLIPLLDPQVNANEIAWLYNVFNKFTPDKHWSGTMQLPVIGRYASYFGSRRNFNRGILHTYHSGLDIAAGYGTPVHAAAGGTVVATEPLEVRGNVVIIDHGRGVFTVYCHLSKFLVQKGQKVEAGELIGNTGNTGRSLGPHLHWELAVGTVTVNPLDWVTDEMP